MMAELAKMLMILGVVLFLLGGAFTLLGKVTGLGRLPGDIIIQRGGLTVYLPLGASLVLSLVLSLSFWLFRR